MLVNGFQIAYTVTADGRVILKTLDKQHAVAALVDHPGATLDTKAVDA